MAASRASGCRWRSMLATKPECLLENDRFASICARFAIKMSCHISGSLAAMRVKSRKPGPASDKKSAAFFCAVMLFIMANASKCGKWLTAAKAASCASGDILCTLQPKAVQIDLRTAELRCQCAANGRENDLPAFVQIDISVFYARHLFACNRVRGYKATNRASPKCVAQLLRHLIWWSPHP